MELKLCDIVDAEGALNRLFGCHPKKARDAFRVARIKREIAPILADYWDARQRLLEQHAIKSKDEPNRWLFVCVDEDGEPIFEFDEDDKEKKNSRTKLDLEALETFSSELDELADTEGVEINSVITLAQIERLGLDPAMTPAEMASLWWLIKEFQEDIKIEDE